MADAMHGRAITVTVIAYAMATPVAVGERNKEGHWEVDSGDHPPAKPASGLPK